MLNRFVFVYLDDILVFSRSAQEHVLQVRQVLQRLLENQLIIKAEKCEFHCSPIFSLGYVIAAGHIQMDPDKVRAVVDWPQPTSSAAATFPGICSFLPPLHPGLQHTGFPPLSTHHSQGSIHMISSSWAFSYLKHRSTTAPILIQPSIWCWSSGSTGWKGRNTHS